MINTNTLVSHGGTSWKLLLGYYQYLLYCCKNVNSEALNSTDRAFGGIIRAKKGDLVETLAEMCVITSWAELQQNLTVLKFKKIKISIYIDEKYI